MKTLLLTLIAIVLQVLPIPKAPEPTASIEGVVVNAANQAVVGAEVRAFWDPPPAAYSPNQVPRTVTDNEGKFVLRELGYGGYRLGVKAPGYAWQEYGAKPGEASSGGGTVIALAPGQAIRGITIPLAAEGVLSGRITSTSGEPLLGMEVYALRKIFDANGFSTLRVVGQRGETNDRGEYRIASLAPGQYYVRAASPFTGPPGPPGTEERVAQAMGRAAIAPSPGRYAPVFFPGVAESSKALLLQLNSGGERRNVDIVLPRQQFHRIRGRVIDPESAQPPERMMVGTFPARVEFVSGVGLSLFPYKPDGTFELPDIVPGYYWVRAQLPGTPMTPEERARLATPGFDVGSRPQPPGGSTLVRVIDSDLANVEVTIVRNLDITGSVTVEGRAASPAEMAAMKVELRLLPPLGNNSPMGSSIMGPDGRFTCKNLSSAEYRLTMSGLAPDLYMKEARIGNVDALTQLIELTKPAPASLTIVLAKGVTVSGTLTDAASQAVPGKEVVLIPDRIADRLNLYKTVTADANGRFTIQGVGPGDYKAFAWRAIEPFQYFDSEFMKQFDDRGSAVRVLDTAPATVNVKIIP